MKIKTISVECNHTKDYCPINIIEEDGCRSHLGGGDIYSAVIGVIANYTGNRFMMDKWDRLHDDDRKAIGKIMATAFNDCEDMVKHIMESFYDTPNKSNPIKG